MVRLRPCLPEDAQALSLVGQATFLETFAGALVGADILEHCTRQHAAALYREWLGQATTAAWLAEAQPGNAPVGYVLLTAAHLPVADPRDDDVEIKRIYLLHRFHGSGIGKLLMGAALDHARARGCRRVLLGVYARNHAAIAFYGRHGFRAVGQRTFRVGSTDCEDVILACDLQQSAEAAPAAAQPVAAGFS